MQIMNIWFFNHYALPPDLPGGTRHYDFGQELVKRSHQVVIFATSFHHYLHRETRLRPGEKWKVEDVNGVRFVWIRTPPYWRNDWRRVRNMIIFALRAWWLGRKLTKLVPEIGKPDVVIGSSPHLLTPLAAYWVARHHRVSFVMEVRDLWPQTIIDMGELSAHHPITKALQTLERFLYHRAEKIISLLAQADKYITACGIPQEKIVWIPNGVDLSRFEGLEHCVTSENGLKVIYLGAHGKANALDTVIQAAKILQDWGYRKIRFVLIGDGPEKPRLIGMAQTLGLKNVEFRKPVPKIEIPKVLREADAFIVQLGGAEVYRWGISSNKLFDFMAVGRPVFSSAEAPLNPVKEAKCGFTIPPWDPKALAEAVIKLYQMSPEERAEMGKRGREYVEKYHDIRKLAAQLENLLQSVLSEKRL
jgi:glycosyltransferase involved in cell wall biosynthesis